MRKISRFLVALVLTSLVTAPALADAKSVRYSPEAFAQAQADGTTIVVDVYASWCPTCRAQAPILEELKSETVSKGVLFMKVDYDRDKDFLRAHRIPRQSTILVFRGEKELSRSIAETNRERLREQVLSAIER